MSKVICFDHDLSKGLNEFQPSTYEFKCPDFGESNTDQSYYEPTASAIANMRRSASEDVIGIFDYTEPLPKGKDGKVDVQKATLQMSQEIDKVERVVNLRSKGSTVEEISQLETDVKADVEDILEKSVKKQKSKDEQVIDAISMKKAIDYSEKSEQSNSV